MLQDNQAQPQVDLRFGPAGLGLVWLPALALLVMLWLAGVAVYLLFATNLYNAVMDGSPFMGPEAMRLGPALLVALASTLPLAFFTVLAGVLGAQLLMICWAEDHIVLDQFTLRVTHRLGPFRWTEIYARAQLRAVLAAGGV